MKQNPLEPNLLQQDSLEPHPLEHKSARTLMPLLFWTTCHMRVRTRLEGPGSCWGQNPPAVVRLWSGAHTQFVITWRKREKAPHINACSLVFPILPLSLNKMFPCCPNAVVVFLNYVMVCMRFMKTSDLMADLIL